MLFFAILLSSMIVNAHDNHTRKFHKQVIFFNTSSQVSLYLIHDGSEYIIPASKKSYQVIGANILMKFDLLKNCADTIANGATLHTHFTIAARAVGDEYNIVPGSAAMGTLVVKFTKDDINMLNKKNKINIVYVQANKTWFIDPVNNVGQILGEFTAMK